MSVIKKGRDRFLKYGMGGCSDGSGQNWRKVFLHID